jgi:hypothetical protein
MADRGDKYDDRGNLGTFGPSQDAPFPDPKGLRRFVGFGADQDDLEQGFITPGIRSDPAYDKANYELRSTVPSRPDEGPGNHMSLGADFEFRTKDMESKGFLTRPRTPTER